MTRVLSKASGRRGTVQLYKDKGKIKKEHGKGQGRTRKDKKEPGEGQ